MAALLPLFAAIGAHQEIEVDTGRDAGYGQGKFRLVLINFARYCISFNAEARPGRHVLCAARGRRNEQDTKQQRIYNRPDYVLSHTKAETNVS